MIKSLLFFVSLLMLISSLEANEKAVKLDKVSIQFQWLHQFQFAGYYMAKEKGFYKDAGLEVEFKEWKHGINVVQEVMSENATFGVGRPNILVNKANGDDVLLLSATFQSSPLVLLTTPDSGIKELKDIKNRKLMSVIDSREDVAIEAMLSSQGLSFDEVKLVQHSFKVNDLLNGKADVMTAYVTDQPHLLEELGVKPYLFKPSDYGFDFYSDILFTQKHQEQFHPHKVEQFTEASLKGWEYAFEHMQESVELIFKKYNTQNKTKEALLYEAKELKKLAYYKSKTMGKIEKTKLDKIVYVYKLMNLIKGDLDTESIIYKLPKKELHYTFKERQWIKENPSIKYSEVNWKPLSIIKDEKMTGIMGEYLELVSKKTRLEFEYVKASSWGDVLQKFKNGEIDLIPGVGSSPQEKFMGLLSDSYASYPMVIITGDKYKYINSLVELEDKVIAVPKYYTSYNFLIENYPNIKLKVTEDIQAALLLVNSGSADAFVGHIAPSLYYMSKLHLSELKISGEADFDFNHHYLVHHDNTILIGIINKTFASISEQEKNEIYAKWVRVQVEQKVDYLFIFELMILFIVSIIAVVIWNYKLKNLVQQKTCELKELNEGLERKVKDRTRELEASKKLLQSLAEHDPLTNLYNRRYLMDVSQGYIALAKRKKESLCVIMLDVDHFKLVNDTFGHKVGDEVLVCISNILVEMTRKSDIVSRYGGEEFVLLLPDTEIDKAVLISEKIRIAVEKHVYCSNEDKISFTVSLGVSSLDLSLEESLDLALTRADKAMYEAKERGRNLVCRFYPKS